MANAVFSCPKCKQLLGDIPAKGALTIVCPRCRLKYQVIRGRVADMDSKQRKLRSMTGQETVLSHDYELRVDLPTGDVEMVSFELPGEDAHIIARASNVLTAVYLMRGNKREQLLSVHNATTGQALAISVVGDRATAKAWGFAGVTAVAVSIVVGGAGGSAAAVAASGIAALVGLGAILGRRFMPRAELSAHEEAQLTAAQRLLSEKLDIEVARAKTIRDLESREELYERLHSLRAKMQDVGLDLYASRIAALDAALETIDQQTALMIRLRQGYERSIQMLEIELEAGAAADAIDAAAASHIAATLAEMRDLEEQQTELARQLAANVEVEGLLRNGR